MIVAPLTDFGWERWVEVMCVKLCAPGHGEGTLAHFDTRLFGQLSLSGWHLRRRDTGEFFVVAPDGGDRRNGNRPRVHLHGGALRAEITRKACAAYRAAQRSGS